MGAALAVGETLAAAVVALMYAGGQALEAFAEGRAARDMNALLDRVPRTAMVHRDGGLVALETGAILPGDRLLIRPATSFPSTASSPRAGARRPEPDHGRIPARRRPRGRGGVERQPERGRTLRHGGVGAAARSTYAGIVRLVEAATRSQAPITRLADRFALGFTAATVALAGLAWWLEGDPVRAVAVLGGRDALSADPGRARRDRGGTLARGADRRARQGRGPRWRRSGGSARSCSTRPARSPTAPRPWRSSRPRGAGLRTRFSASRHRSTRRRRTWCAGPGRRGAAAGSSARTASRGRGDARRRDRRDGRRAERQGRRAALRARLGRPTPGWWGKRRPSRARCRSASAWRAPWSATSACATG